MAAGVGGTPPSSIFNCTISRNTNESTAVSGADAGAGGGVNGTNVVLQFTDSLASPINWQKDANLPTSDGVLKTVTLDPAPGTRFFRLGPP